MGITVNTTMLLANIKVTVALIALLSVCAPACEDPTTRRRLADKKEDKQSRRRLYPTGNAVSNTALVCIGVPVLLYKNWDFVSFSGSATNQLSWIVLSIIVAFCYLKKTCFSSKDD